jgi:glycerophosphoryl diester phosphodiesterase
MVTHDDEIWRNEYGADRSGGELPSGETRASYLVGQKTADELKRVAIGRNGETMPTLSEVMELVGDANETLVQYGKNPIILNIELKDDTAVSAMLDLVADGAAENASASLENIVFCSFKHEALKELKAEAERRGMTGINIAPGIKTADLFGKENMNEDFSLKDPKATYHAKAMKNLHDLVDKNGFRGYDGILWDLREPIVELAASDKVALHASTSDFRQYGDNRDFALVLLELSKRVDTFFKCDNVDDARRVLIDSSMLMAGIGIQMMHKRAEDGGDCFYFYRPDDQQQDNSKLLRTGAKKPIAYSKLGRE